MCIPHTDDYIQMCIIPLSVERNRYDFRLECLTKVSLEGNGYSVNVGKQHVSFVPKQNRKFPIDILNCISTSEMYFILI